MKGVEVFIIVLVVATALGAIGYMISPSPTGLQVFDESPTQLSDLVVADTLPFRLNLNSIFFDPEGAPLLFTVEDPAVFLEGDILSFAPPANFFGDYQIVITVSDGINTIAKPFTFTVYSPVQAAVFESPTAAPPVEQATPLPPEEAPYLSSEPPAQENTNEPTPPSFIPSSRGTSDITISSTNLSSCQTISNATPGTYIMDTDVSAAGTCMTITTGSVTVDCNGFTITYNTGGGTATSGITGTGLSNVTIHDCRVIDGSVAGANNVPMRFTTMTNSEIHDNILQSNGTTTNHGLLLTSPNNVSVYSNTIRGTGTTTDNDGIQLLNSAVNTTINDNDVFAVGTSGIAGITMTLTAASSSAQNNSITGNTIAPSGTSSVAGVQIAGVATNAQVNLTRITGNTITLAGGSSTINDDGIAIGQNTLFINNTVIEGNTVTLSDMLDEGIDLVTSRNNTQAHIGSNTFTGPGYGIRVSRQNTHFKQNISTSNTINGQTIYYYGGILDSPACPGVHTGNAGEIMMIECSVNTIQNAVVNGPIFIYNQSFMIFDGVEVQARGDEDVAAAAIWGAASNLIINRSTFLSNTGQDNDGFESFVAINDVFIANSTFNRTAGGGIAFDADHSSSIGNARILENTFYDGTNMAVDIGGDNVVFSRNNVLNGIVELVGTDNLNITNNSIQNNGSSALVTSSTNVIVENNTFRGEVSSDTFVDMCCGSHYVRNNTFIANGSIDYTVSLATAPGWFINNSITSTGVNDFHLLLVDTSSGMLVENNDFYRGFDANNEVGGIELETTDNDTIRNNRFIISGQGSGENGAISGILFDNSRNIAIMNNTFFMNGTSDLAGISLEGGNDSYITNNSIIVTTSGARGNGVILQRRGNAGFSFNNTVFANVIFINTTGNGSGVLLRNATRNIIDNNTITSNGTLGDNVGVELDVSYNNTVSRNSIITNGTNNFDHGILLINTSGNTLIFGNIISTYGLGQNNGIRLESNSNNNTIQNNSVIATGTGDINHGIRVSSSSNVTATDNSVYTFGPGSDGEGITFNTVTYGNVSRNRISTNTSNQFSYGIGYYTSSHGDVSFNNITTNGSGGFNQGIKVEFTSTNTTVNNNIVTTDGGAANNAGIVVSQNAQNNTFQNNFISTTGATSEGVRIRSFANNSYFTNTTIVTNGTNSYGVQMGTGSGGGGGGNAADRSYFNHTRLVNVSQWIQTAASNETQFYNTTFETTNGSINIIQNFSISGTLNITKTNLNVSLNNSYLNSTNLTGLNTTAQITLNGLNFSNPSVVVDYEDDGTFATCSSPTCNETSYNGSTFVFNVSHFSTYAASESSTSCPLNITTSTTLTENLTCPETAIQLQASDIVLDCAGNTVTWGTLGLDGADGVTGNELRNVTVQNCHLIHGATTGNGTTGISFARSNNSLAVNNTVFNIGEENANGINFALGTNHSRAHNNTVTINSSSVFSFGVTTSDGENNTLSNNIVASDTFGAGEYSWGIVVLSFLAGAPVEDIIVENNTVNAFGLNARGVYLEQADRTLVHNNSVLISSNGSADVYAVSFVGLSFNNTLVNNTIAAVATLGGTRGVLITDSNTNTVANNTITTNGTHDTGGIFVSVAEGNTFIGNTLHSINGTGILLWDNTNDSIVRSNTITLNSFGESIRGVYTQGNNHNHLIENNTIAGNGSGTHQGIIIETTQNATVRNNTIALASDPGTFSADGIWILTSNQTRIENNTLTFDGTGVYLQQSLTTTFEDQSILFPPLSPWGSLWIDESDGTIMYRETLNASLESLMSDIVNISANLTRVNTTTPEGNQFNASANISILNLAFTDPQVVVDYEDDGTFAVCSSPICNETNYAGGTFMFNVSHFTSYAASETTVSSNGTCPGIITTDFTLTTDINGTTLGGGNCIETTTSGITIDCQGYIMTGDNISNAIFVNAQNVTTQNCVLLNWATGIQYTDANNGIIRNNSINQSTTQGINVHLSNDTFVAHNSINSTAFGSGINYEGQLFGVTTGNIAYNNTIDTPGTTCLDVQGYPNPAQATFQDNTVFNCGTALAFNAISNGLVENLTAYNGSQIGISTGAEVNLTNIFMYQGGSFSAFDALSTVMNLYIENSTNGLSLQNTTAFPGGGTQTIQLTNVTVLSDAHQWLYASGFEDVANTITNFTFGSNNGSVTWTGTHILPSNPATVGDPFDGSLGFNETYNLTQLNSTFLPFLNTSARISLFGLPFTTPTPLVDFEDDGMFVTCSAPQCENSTYSAGNFTFDVLSFTGYAASETISACACPGSIVTDTTLTCDPVGDDTCITVDADDITLDCAGHTVRYNNNGGALENGVFSDTHANLVVKNCVIVDDNLAPGDFGTNGIQFNNIVGALIINNTITSAGDGFTRGIQIDASTAVNMTNNTLRGNGTSCCNNGLSIQPGTTQYIVSGNVFTSDSSDSNFNHAMSSDGASDGLVENNTASAYGFGCCNAGYNLASGSNITVQDNSGIADGLDSFNDGVAYTTITGGLIDNNTLIARGLSSSNSGVALLTGTTQVTANNNSIFTDGTDSNAGIVLVSSPQNRLENNSVSAGGSTVANHGIHLISSSDGTVISNNTVRIRGNGGSAGVRVFQSANETIANNSVSANTTDGAIGISFESYANDSLAENNTLFVVGDGSDDYGFLVAGQSRNNTILRNIVTSTSLSGGNCEGIRFSEAIDTTVLNNTFTTQGSAGGCDGLEIGTLTNGTLVSGNRIILNGTANDNDGVTVLSGSNNNTIQNNTISTQGTDNNNGVSLILEAHDNLVVNNTISTNGTDSGYGIYLSGADNNTVRSNFVNATGSGVNNKGIYAENSDNNTLTANVLNTFGTDSNVGIHLAASTNTAVMLNDIHGNGSGNNNDGVRTDVDSNDTVVDQNNATTDGTTFNEAVSIENSQRTNVTSNTLVTFNTGGFGSGVILFNGANHSLVMNNTITGVGPTVNGLSVGQSSHNNILTNNSINITGDDNVQGARIDDNSSNNTISANVFAVSTQSAGDAVLLSFFPHDNLITNNIGTVIGLGNADGIHLQFSTANNRVTFNNMTVNGGITVDGIILFSGTNNTAADNNFSVNSAADSAGLHLLNESGSTVSNNTAISNGAGSNQGIQLTDSRANTIQNNTATAIASAPNAEGILISTSNTTNVTNNTLAAIGTGTAFGAHIQSNSHANTLTGNIISVSSTSDGAGIIIIADSAENTAQNNTVIASGAGNTDGIHLEANANNNRVLGNAISSTAGLNHDGMISFTATNNTFANNTVLSTTTAGGFGFRVIDSNDTLVANNSISISGPQSIDIEVSPFTGAFFNGPIKNTTFSNNTLGATYTKYSARITQSLNNVFNESFFPGAHPLLINETNGLINYTQTVNLSLTTNLSRVVTITPNAVFVNSTNASGNQLNRTADLTLTGIAFTDPTPIVAFEGIGFAPCEPPQCVERSYNGSHFIYDVASFTTYSSNNTAFNFTLSKVDDVDPVANGSNVTYTITITNNGNQNLYNLTIVESYPTQSEFVSSTPAPTLGNNTFVILNLTPGQSTTINITLNMTSLTSVVTSNNATLTAFNFSGQNASATVSEPTTILVPGSSLPGGSGGGGGGGSGSTGFIRANITQYPLAVVTPPVAPSVQTGQAPQIPTPLVEQTAKQSGTSQETMLNEEEQTSAAWETQTTDDGENDRGNYGMIFGLGLFLIIFGLIFALLLYRKAVQTLPRHARKGNVGHKTTAKPSKQEKPTQIQLLKREHASWFDSFTLPRLGRAKPKTIDLNKLEAEAAEIDRLMRKFDKKAKR